MEGEEEGSARTPFGGTQAGTPSSPAPAPRGSFGCCPRAWGSTHTTPRLHPRAPAVPCGASPGLVERFPRALGVRLS